MILNECLNTGSSQRVGLVCLSQPTHHTSLLPGKASHSAGVFGASADFRLRYSLRRIIYTALSVARREISSDIQMRRLFS